MRQLASPRGALLALLGYADDVVLIAKNMRGLQERMALLEQTCTRAGMILSDKTKLLHVNSTPGAAHPPLQLRNFTVEQVLSFAYLGSEVNLDQDLARTIRDRLAKASAAFARLGHIWDARTLPMRTKAKLYL